MNVKIINHSRSLEKPLRVKNCESFFCRLKGLMFKTSIGQEDGLLLVYKSESRTNTAIHMFFVGMDLGVVWLNQDREIVDIKMAKSWAPYYTPRSPAMYILEIHPDRLVEFNLGDKLSFE